SMIRWALLFKDSIARPLHPTDAALTRPCYPLHLAGLACRLARMNLKMPDLSTTGSPITVVRWLVAVGDFVERGQAVLEVETDKATTEVEALNSGILLQQLVPAGDEAYAGQVLAIIGEARALPVASRSSNKPDEGLTEYDRDFLLSLYERMLLIRRFEDRV